MKNLKQEGKSEHPLLKLVDLSKIPAHVAIIMDGNGRWAKSRGLARIEGHKAGIEAVKAAVEAAQEIGVKYLTLYAFSVENWKRPEKEVRELFNLLDTYLEKEKEKIEEEEIRIRTIGRLNDLPKKTKKNLEEIQNKTINSRGLTLTFALSYSGRAEICDAIKRMIDKAKMGEFNSEVKEEIVRKYLYAPDLPDPDLLIRTSGEYRISNFLLWQIAYTEIIILDVLWPDFRQEHFYEAVLDFQRRERRYGGVSE